jgi:hypothetical protein
MNQWELDRRIYFFSFEFFSYLKSYFSLEEFYSNRIDGITYRCFSNRLWISRSRKHAVCALEKDNNNQIFQFIINQSNDYRFDISLFLSVFWSVILSSSSSSSSSFRPVVKYCCDDRARWLRWCTLRLRSSWGYCSVLINDVVGGIMIGFVLIVVDERILVGIWLVVGVVHSPRRFD